MQDVLLRERMRFQLRMDAYNVLNHPVFGSRNTQQSNSQFGFIASQGNRPRTLQFTARLNF